MPTATTLPAALSSQVQTWQIHAEASKRLGHIYQRNLNARLLTMLEQWFTIHQDAPGYSSFLALQAQKDKLRWTTPALVWFTLVDGNSLAAERIEEIMRRLRSTLETPAPLPLSYEYDLNWAQYACDTIQRDLLRAGMSARLALSPQDADSARAQGYCEQALSLLAQCWPDAFQEFQTLIRNVIFIKGEGLRSSMLPQTFGAIYLGLQALEDEIAALDFLIHETTHHSVTIKLAISRFVDNPDAFAQSPLRPDPRPLLPILHAVVVLMRVCWGLQAVLNTLSTSQRLSAEKRLRIYRRDLRDGIATLAGVARWTETGAAFFTQLQRDAQQLSA